MGNYEQLKRQIAQGWNTWNTRSVLSHVLLPQGYALNLGLREYRDSRVLREGLIGRFGAEDEQIRPGPHTCDGSYTRLELQWRGNHIVIESAAVGEDLVLLVTPLQTQLLPPALLVEGAILWNREGWVRREVGVLHFAGSDCSVDAYATAPQISEPNVGYSSPYLAMTLAGSVGISTGRVRGVEEIRALLDAALTAHEAEMNRWGRWREAYEAMQTCLAWDTIYEPSGDRVITPVSRAWSVDKGGFVLFCWDTYFAALMAMDNKALAYSNAIEITRTGALTCFVPNYTGMDQASLDRSQPPVGSLVVRELYRRYRERWLLEEVVDDLLRWNRWFFEHRHAGQGMMAWGSDPRPIVTGNYWESAGINGVYGGALESGLDNSPMYDDAAFDPDRHIMLLADVGLTALYALDCAALADLLAVLGRAQEAQEVLDRRQQVVKGTLGMWDEGFGLCCNRHLDSGAFSRRLSPTNFYALAVPGWSPRQVRAMMAHLKNPQEFWGEHVLPSIARNDPAYADQDYWRGRIWAPMNFLVYIAMRHQDTAAERRELADKSLELLLQEWRSNGHVHENYNADTGEGCDRMSSDRYYHWGALLALPALMEAGVLPGPETPL